MATSQTATAKKTASRTSSTRAAKTSTSKAKAAKSPATKTPTTRIKAETAVKTKKTSAKKAAALPSKKTSKPKIVKTPAVANPTASARLILIMTPELRYKSIQAAAYLRAEKRGFASGHALEDWVAAEREIDAMLKAM